MVPPPPQESSHAKEKTASAEVTIVGGGIVGLTLALAIHQHCGIRAEIFERAPRFVDDVGAGMGMYPNGLRVLRDIDQDLVQQVRDQGYPYKYRRWEHHDGSLITTAEEDVLADHDTTVESTGIRRWRLQKILFEAVQQREIHVHFNKEIVDLHDDVDVDDDGRCLRLTFTDGTTHRTKILFAADGGKSAVREKIGGTAVTGTQSLLQYTGVTCLMGIADCGSDVQGICFPTSTSTQCHAVFFPTGHSEQCFQFHFPVAADYSDQGSWGNLSKQMSREKCLALAEKLAIDGWHERYLQPLRNVSKAIKIGFCLLQPRLDQWVFANSRVVLVGDAAHPPVPYTGQGAQQGLEDAGTIALLLRELCLDYDRPGHLCMDQFAKAMKIYEAIRIPRTSEVSDASIAYGRTSQKCADSVKFGIIHEETLQRQVFFHETLPCILLGAAHDYKVDVQEALQQQLNVKVCFAKKNADDTEAPQQPLQSVV